jgi:hypothetical protein
LGRNQYRLGRHSDAERNLRWALNVEDPKGKLGPPEVAKIAPTMISLLMDHGRWSEAEPLALRVLAIRDSLADTLALQTVAQLVRLYEGWGKPERAAEYQKRLKIAESDSPR